MMMFDAILKTNVRYYFLNWMLKLPHPANSLAAVPRGQRACAAHVSDRRGGGATREDGVPVRGGVACCQRGGRASLVTA